MLSKAISLRMISVLVVSALSALGAAVAQDATNPPPRPAKLIEIIAQDPVTQVTLPMIIEARVSAQLTAQVGGIIRELPVQEGQVVKAGDLIAQIDTKDLQNDLDQARTQLDSAEVEFTRAETLISKQLITRSSFDQLKSQKDIAALALEAALKRLEDATLTAPFDGIIAVLNVRQFQTVSPQEPLITLQNQVELEAVTNVPAQAVANSANVEVENTSVVLDVAPSQIIPVEFKSISPQADAATQTFEARFAFQAPEGMVILPGMTGELHAAVRQTGENAANLAIQVPLSSVLFDGSDTFVWVVDAATMTVTRRAVKLAPAIGEMLPVSEGLSVGDTIVGAGASYLHEGMTIRRFEE